MTRTFFSILFIVGHVLGLSPAAWSEEVEKFALRQNVGQKIAVGFFGQKKFRSGLSTGVENLEQGIVGGILFLAETSQAELTSKQWSVM
jgi:hypothetical protein